MGEFKIRLGIDFNDGELKGLKNKLNNTQFKKIPIELNTKKVNSQLNSIRKQIQNLSNIKINLGANSTGEIQKTIKDLTQLDNKYKNTKSNLQDKIRLKLDNGSFEADIAQLETKLSKLGTEANETKGGIDRLRKAVDSMETSLKNGDVDGAISDYERYKKTLKEVENQLKINKAAQEQVAMAQKKVTSTKSLSLSKEKLDLDIENWLKNNSAAAAKFGTQLRDIQARIKSCDASNLKNLRAEFTNIQKQALLAGKATQTLGDRLKNQFQRYSAYFSVASAFMYVTQGLRDMFRQVVAIDSAMVELKKVTDETNATYNEFLTNASKRASEIGTTIDGLVSSTADFARLGYEFKDAAGLAEVANIYTVVGDEIDSVDTATQSLISTMKAFKDEVGNVSESDFAMDIVDKMNEVSNNFAISSGGIGEALTRSASSLAAANNSLDESIALITASNTVVQDPTVVGTALKTISMRIRGAKTEMEEAGLETEGMVESTAKLREEIMALSGVDIMLDENTFKSTYQIMEDLAAKWGELTDIQQASVTELIAGKRQGNIVSSLMTNFDVAQDALATSLGSEGSATREHEKWLQSLEAKINQLKAAWQGLSQAFMSSDFLKNALDVIIKLVEGLTVMIDKVGTLPTLIAGFAAFKGMTGKGFLSFDKDNKSISLFGTNLNKTSKAISLYNKHVDKADGSHARFSSKMSTILPQFASYTSGLNNAKASMGGYVASLAKGAIKSAAMSAATGLLQGGIIALASVAISFAIKKFDELHESADELSERIDNLTSDYQSQHSELVKGKGSFESMASTYTRLSKGVDSLGRNVSLTSNEYAEYQSVVNSIAEQVPSLVAGYDSQGNAILNCAGNVNELTAAYEELIKTQNDKILLDAKDIEEDFSNKIESFNEKGKMNDKLTTDTSNAFEEILNNAYSADDIADYFENNASKTGLGLTEMVNAIKDAGIEVLDENGEVFDLGVLWSRDTGYEYVAAACEQNRDAVRAIVNDFNTTLDAEAEGMKSIAEATLSDAFDISDSQYFNMNDTLQSIARQVVSGFDGKFYTELANSGESVKDYIHNMLDEFKNLNANETAELEAVFDLQTKFNNGDVSYGEYVSGVKEAEEVINGLNLDDEVKSQIKLALNTEEIASEYEALENRLRKITEVTGRKSNKKGNEIKEFLNGLSAEELSVAVDIIPEMDEGATLKEIQSAIDREMAIRGLVFDLNIEVEATGIEAVNTALAETVSATGLSADSIAALKGRYAELEEEGYDISSMFEETSNGIHLNREAFSKLEQAYAKGKLEDVDADLKTLKKEYDNLTTEIDNCTEASDRAALYSQRDAILQQINDCATLASQYEGLASAYNAWQNTESAGQERDMYENIIEGFENIEDEISRGWLDDGTIKFLELLTGETDLASKSGKELKEVYEDLDDTIKNTSYSVSDFFTVDDDGNSTNAGVYNFLDAIHQLEKTDAFKNIEGIEKLVEKDSDGNIIGFDFELVAKKDKDGNIVKNGDQVIAEALGISEELVQIMLRAADDAGFVVNLEGAYTQLADLKSEAETAKDALKDLKDKGLKELEGVNVDFNLEAEGEDLVKEQSRAVKLLDKFRNEDGTINLDMKGAEDALEIAEYLTVKIDDLTEPKYMQIDTSTVDEDLQEPLEKMQEFERLSKTSHLAALKGDQELLKETEDSMAEIVDYLWNLDNETRIDLGLDGLTPDEIAEKLETGEIEIPANLSVDLEMSDDLKDMRLMMMNELGLASDNEVKLKVGYDIDESVVDGFSENQQERVVKYFADHEEVDNYTPEEKTALAKYVADGGDLDDYEPEEKEAIVKYLADGGDVEDYTPEEKQAIVEYLTDSGDPDNWTPEQKEAVAKFKKDSAEIDNYSPEDKKAVAKFIKDSSEPDNYNPPSKTQDVKADLDSSEPDNYEPKDKEFTVKAVLKKIGDWTNKLLSGGSTRRVVNGTANVDGTAFIGGTTGRAFKHGDWSTKDSGTALVGELGTETLVRNGRYYTIGDAGAEFIDYEKGDIIFNHKQTEELFRYGKVTSGGGRGRALANGTAFAEGLAFDSGSNGSGGIGKVGGKSVTVKADTVNVTSKTSSNKSTANNKTTKSKDTKNKSKDTKDDFEETFDWIEIAIKRLERTIDRLDQKASRTWKSWSYRNKNLKDEISKINDEINLQEKAYNKYIAKANSVGLSSDWKKKVQNGQVNIQDIKDENLAEKIKEYQEWYEKALECKDAILELKDAEMEAYKQIFDNVVSKYDGIIAQIEHRMSMMNAFIERQETDGHIVSTAYYAQLIAQEESNIAELEAKRAELIQERANWVAAGGEVGSEEWNEMTEEINATTLAIEEGETAIIEFNNAIRQIEWDTFDLLQDKISNITKEAEFLIELMSNDDLYDDNGQLTAQGMATMGLHAQNYNINMAQADDYDAEIAEIDEALAEDPYDQELLARRQELVEKQQESILAAEAEKEAIRDMVEEGIEVELDALQERIDKYEEALDAQKDLYDYQKKVKEQTKEIADLEKQIAAYAGDDSEEARAKLQELKISLEDAKEELKETEYEKYISDQKALLDSLYDEYETILNSRLDNIDVLIEDMIGYVNENSDTINQTIHDEADAVGYDLSEETENIWGSNGLAGQVIGQYGDDFTAIKTVLNDIKIFVAKMAAASDVEANANISEENATNTENTTNTSNGSGSSGNNSNNNRNNNNNNNNKVIKTGGKINAKNAKIYSYKGDKTGARQYYRNDPIYKVLKMDGNWLQVRYHKLTKGVTGWFKKGDVKAYKTGVKDILDNQIAWTQENGKREFIVRPSDGAILTPLARGDSVLNANASGNIWDMANNPAEFIKNNLDLGIGSVPNMINTQNSYIQNLDNVTFNLPNVQNYNELLSAMQKDKNFEKLILSMSIDRVAGRSYLAKGKAIR